MTDFIIESANQELGRHLIIAGDTQRMRANFTPYLGRGDVLQAFTLGCTSVAIGTTYWFDFAADDRTSSTNMVLVNNSVWVFIEL